MMTFEQAYLKGLEILNLNGIKQANIDAWYLLEEYLKISKASYLVNKNKLVNIEDYSKYIDAINLRATHFPLQYIIGKWEFMGYEFFVNRNVLIPRQDTEILVEEVIKYADGKSILDMCTGSGCIIISIAKLCNLTKSCGTDISLEALNIAKKNNSYNNTNVDFIQGDLFENVNENYDIIVSNPPYICSDIIEKLDDEVKMYEPRIALDGFEDGLYFYKKIIQNAKNYLNNNGMLFLEIGYDQAKSVVSLMRKEHYKDVKVIKDLAGLDRVIKGKLN